MIEIDVVVYEVGGSSVRWIRWMHLVVKYMLAQEIVPIDLRSLAEST
jgi:hypothetical protein